MPGWKGEDEEPGQVYRLEFEATRALMSVSSFRQMLSDIHSANIS